MTLDPGLAGWTQPEWSPIVRGLRPLQCKPETPSALEAGPSAFWTQGYCVCGEPIGRTPKSIRVEEWGCVAPLLALVVGMWGGWGIQVQGESHSGSGVTGGVLATHCLGQHCGSLPSQSRPSAHPCPRDSRAPLFWGTGLGTALS